MNLSWLVICFVPAFLLSEIGQCQVLNNGRYTGRYPGYLNRPSYPVSGNKKPYYGSYGVGKPSYPVSERKKPYYGSYGVGNPQHLRHDSLMQMIKPIIPHAITDPPPPP